MRPSWIVFLLSLVWMAVSMAGVPIWSILPSFAGFALAFALEIRGKDTVKPRAFVVWMVWIALGLIAWTFLQQIPMPHAVVSSLAPHNADVWRRSLRLFGEASPSTYSLSVSPISTRIEVVRGATYLALFLAAWRIAEAKRGIQFLMGCAVGIALLIAFAHVVHPLLAVDKVWGLITPRSKIDERHLGPIINPNALADLVNIGFAVAFVDLLQKRNKLPRVLTGISAVALATFQIWNASRGGVLSLGIVAVLGAALTTQRSRLVEKRWPLFVLAAIACVVVVLTYSTAASTELLDGNVSKLTMHKKMLSLFRPYGFFGMGRGAFESAYPEYRVDLGYLRFTHPEQMILQWTVEWGLPVAVAAFIALLITLRPRAVLSSAEGVPFWIAAFAFAAHNMLDLGSEVPLNIALLALLAGVAGAGVSSERARHVGVRTKGLAAAGALVAILVGLSTIDKDLYEERDELRALVLSHPEPDAFRVRLREAIARHPAEPYFPYVGALYAFDTRDPRIIAWVAQTLARSPVYGPAHYLLARYLSKSVPSQARVEFRYALEQAPEYYENAAKDAAALVGKYEDATELFPPEVSNLFVGALAQELQERLPATTFRLRERLERAGDQPSLELLALSSVRDLEQRDLPPCDVDEEACRTHAAKRVEQFAKGATTCNSIEMQARLAIVGAQGTARTTALRKFAADAEVLSERRKCLVRVLDLSMRYNEARIADDTVERLSRSTCVSANDCGNLYSYLSSKESERRNPQRALAFARKAMLADPERNDLAEQCAQLAHGLKLYNEAAELYAKLVARDPANVAYREGLAKAREESRRVRLERP